MNTTPCPVCRAPCVAHPGKPPGKWHSFFNRCPNLALTGHPGSGRSSRQPGSWWEPERGNGRCGTPLTREDGTVIEPLPLEEFIEFTRRKFDVKELKQLVLG